MSLGFGSTQRTSAFNLDGVGSASSPFSNAFNSDTADTNSLFDSSFSSIYKNSLQLVDPALQNQPTGSLPSLQNTDTMYEQFKYMIKQPYIQEKLGFSDEQIQKLQDLFKKTDLKLKASQKTAQHQADLIKQQMTTQGIPNGQDLLQLQSSLLPYIQELSKIKVDGLFGLPSILDQTQLDAMTQMAISKSSVAKPPQDH